MVDDLKQVGLDAELTLVKAPRNAAKRIADFARDTGVDIFVVGNRGYGSPGLARLIPDCG